MMKKLNEENYVGKIWKDIKGYEGLYQVSNWGRVKSLNYRRTGKEIKIWPSANEIQRELGYSTGSICACCRGGHYVKGKWYNLNQAYGYIWQYAEANTN